MKKTARRLASITAALLFLILLAGCGGSQLPEGMEQSAAEAQAKAIIEAANALDYAKMQELFSPNIPLTEEQWQLALEPIMDQLGKFQSYGKTAFATSETNDYGTLGVVAVECQYENSKLVWKISIDEDGHIVGFVA